MISRGAPLFFAVTGGEYRRRSERRRQALSRRVFDATATCNERELYLNAGASEIFCKRRSEFSSRSTIKRDGYFLPPD